MIVLHIYGTPGHREGIRVDTSIVIAKKDFPAGSVFCKKGELCPNIYLLLSGSVNVSVGDRIVQIIDKRGSFIGELSPLINQPGVSTLVASTHCECIVIPIKYLQEIIEEHPEDRVNLLGILASHILKKSRGLPGLDIDLETIGLKDQSLTKSEKELSERRRIVLVAKKDNYRAALDFHFEPMGFKIDVVEEPEAIIQNLDSFEGQQFYDEGFRPGVREDPYYTYDFEYDNLHVRFEKVDVYPDEDPTELNGTRNDYAWRYDRVD